MSIRIFKKTENREEQIAHCIIIFLPTTISLAFSLTQMTTVFSCFPLAALKEKSWYGYTLNERKQNDEKGGERAIVRQMRWLAGSIILPVLEHYENRIIFTILFALQESR